MLITSRTDELRLLSETLAHLGEGVVITESELNWPGPRIIFVNKAMSEITGYSAEEMIGQTPRMFQGSGTCRSTLQNLKSELAKERRTRAEVINYRKDGTPYNAELSVAPLFDDKGRLTNFVSVHRDITERVKAEHWVHDREEHLQAILNSTVDAIITIDRNGTIVSVNPATEKIFGYTSDEMVGKNVKMLMPSPHREKHDDYLGRYQKTGEAHIIGIGREVAGRRKDGSTFPADLAISEVDHLGLYTGILRDITRRKKAEEELRAQHEFNERLIETARHIILMLDQQGRIVYFNPILEKLSGWTLAETEGRDWFDTFLPGRDSSRLRQLFEQTLKGERTPGKITPLLTRDGDERQIEWFDAPLTNGDDEQVGVLCTGVDVSERLRLEQEVYKASEEEKNRIARDLHDDLGALLGGTGLIAFAMKRNLDNGIPIRREDMNTVALQIKEAITLSRSLAHGLHPVGDEPGAFEKAIRKLIERLRASGLRCRLVAPAKAVEIPDSSVSNHLYRIAQEATQNTLRYSGASHLTIHLNQDDRIVRLSIKDNGNGFDVNAIPGDGMGLKTMRYRARAIGGLLTIESGKGKGTRITCEAPVNTHSSPTA